MKQEQTPSNISVDLLGKEPVEISKTNGKEKKRKKEEKRLAKQEKKQRFKERQQRKSEIPENHNGGPNLQVPTKMKGAQGNCGHHMIWVCWKKDRKGKG